MNACLTLPYVHLGETEPIDLEIKRSYYRRLAVKSHITYSERISSLIPNINLEKYKHPCYVLGDLAL